MSSIDYESLLEFEESLRSSGSSNKTLLLHNLESKVDSNRITNFDNNIIDTPATSASDNDSIVESIVSSTTTNTGADQYSFDDLHNIMDSYDFTTDEFTTCANCGKSLCDPTVYSSCCTRFVSSQSNISSSLEKSYWLAFINNPSRTINTLPNYTEMLFLQQGIPCQLRSMIWRKMILIDCQHTGNNVPQTSKLIYNNFQHSYTASISKQISKDLCRTFPSVSFFKTEKTIKELSTILNVYANYDVELGYCQGLLFLVGALHYHFKDDVTLTFHALCSIMESERELHNIFTTTLMSSTLQTWNEEFAVVLRQVDPDLHDHMAKFVEFQVFLFQWWLSFVSSHTPDLSIVNRIMDFCMLQGWKVGMFKISVGLLVVNKPILMSLKEGDEEVVYQHLLNDSKWGNIINDLDMFFGNLLLSWDDSLFLKLVAGDEDSASELTSQLSPATNHHPSNHHQHTRTGSSMMDMFKGFKISSNNNGGKDANRSSASLSSTSSTASRRRSDSGESSFQNQNRSSLSVFSMKTSGKPSDVETDSLYSDITSDHSNEEDAKSTYGSSPVTSSSSSSRKSSFGEFWKFPRSYLNKSFGQSSSSQQSEQFDEQTLSIPTLIPEEPNTPLQSSHAHVYDTDTDATPQLIPSSTATVPMPSVNVHQSSCLHHDEVDYELLMRENQHLKRLLRQSYDVISGDHNDELKFDILKAVEC